MRSVPEKTFEHWCSMHLSYRYRANLQLWWPSSTADIDVAGGPLAVGKRIWLELKSTEWNPAQGGRHDLFVDLPQLRAYGANPVTDYYVFPAPPWTDVLGEPGSLGWLNGLDRTSVAYQSRSGAQWFAHWTFVVPGATLRASLATQIAALAPGVTKKSHRVASIQQGGILWVEPTLNGSEVHWRDFWRSMELCGGGNQPAQFVLPDNALPLRQDAAYTDVVGAVRNFRQSGKSSTDVSRDNLSIWTHRQDGRYVRDSGQSLATGFSWKDEDDRVMVLLGADALNP